MSSLLRRRTAASAAASTPTTVQRIPPGSMPAFDANSRAKEALGEDFDTKSDAGKIAVIRRVVAQGNADAMLRGWSRLSDEVGQARANTGLFTQSVKLDSGLLDHAAFRKLRETFRKDVEGLAISNLAANRNLIATEMEKTGVAADLRGEDTTTEHDVGVQDIQRQVPNIEKIRRDKREALGKIVGFEYGGLDRQLGEPQRKWKRFSPSSPPDESASGYPSWETVNAQWKRILLAESALIRTTPSAAYFLGEGNPDMGGLKDASDIKAARAAIATALNDLAAKIDKAVPLIGSDISFLDLPPLQQQLLIGGPSASGTNWSKPVEKALASEETADANVTNLLTTLGLASLSAAFFIFASIATAGGAAALGTFLFAGGAVASGVQAGISWDKYRDLSTVREAAIDPELALVSGEQVDSALIGAILDSVFAALDVWQAGKGIVAGVKAIGKKEALLGAGKSGAANTARAALNTLGSAGVNEADVITRAVLELGPDEVRKVTGMDLERLARKVGKESEVGKRLLEFGSHGISESTRKLLDRLPDLGKLGATEGEEVLRAAVETHGVIGTLDRVGGWAVIKKSPVMKAGTGSAAVMEGWRRGLVKELQEYIAKESEGLSKAVQTGTEKASSDVDVQIVSGTAGELQQKAEAWLSGRVGKDVTGAKKLLDAEVFVDPFRSHFFDVAQGLDDVTRKELASKMGDWNRRMMAGAEINAAGGIATSEGRSLADKWARQGVAEPFLRFKALTPAEQKTAAQLIDGWMAGLKEIKDPAARGNRVLEICQTQAHINASHPDAYVGDGVKVWVTGREDALQDVEKLAAAVNMDPSELMKLSSAQRISAALNEAKWLDAAAKRLRNPVANSAEDLGQVAKDVTDIGKHGARGAGQLSKAGAPNAAVLDGLFAELESFRNMPSDMIEAAFRQGRFGTIEAEITGLLERLKTATWSAVDGLEKELKTFASTGPAMDEFHRLTLWRVRYRQHADKAIQATSLVIKLLKTSLSEQIQQSVQEPEPDKSAAPPAAASPSP